MFTVTLKNQITGKLRVMRSNLPTEELAKQAALWSVSCPELFVIHSVKESKK